MPRLILFYKRYGVLSRFTDARGRPTLAHYLSIPGVYPAGRLDFDSEGLLLLTDDGGLQHRISDPRHALKKIYWAQIEGVPEEPALTRLRQGVVIQGQGTRPADVKMMPPPDVAPREPPIRVRRHIPTTWLAMTLTEGRNRQVRRMTAAVGHPTLRLIRYAVGPWTLDGLTPGEWRELEV